jgi:hypothetical protein
MAHWDSIRGRKLLCHVPLPIAAGVVHKGSEGMSTVFPDVCMTPSPGGPIPIPYPNIGMASDTSDGPSKVKADGQMPMVKGAKCAMTAAMKWVRRGEG